VAFTDYAAGEATVVSIGGTLAVEFTTPLGGTDYAVTLTLEGPSAAADIFYVTDKTVNGFTIHVINSAGAPVDAASTNVIVNWIAVRNSNDIPPI
jgi:hypothetical protein